MLGLKVEHREAVDRDDHVAGYLEVGAVAGARVEELSTEVEVTEGLNEEPELETSVEDVNLKEGATTSGAQVPCSL